MSVDYNAMDEEADVELAEAYGTESVDSPEEAGTESQPEETVAEAEEATPETVEEHNQEPVVAESRYKEAVRAMNRAQQELAEYRKQSDSRDQMIAQLQEQVAALQQAKPSEDEPDLSEAKELYPEVVNPLLKTIESLKKQLAKVTEDVTGVQGFADRYQQSEAQLANERYRAEIRNAHPDVDQIENSNEFWNWVDAQAPLIQLAVSSKGSAKDAIAALNLYRAESGIKPVVSSNKTDKLAAAREAAVPSVRGSGKPESKQTYTADEIAKMSRAEFLKHEAAIDEAMARGEIY